MLQTGSTRTARPPEPEALAELRDTMPAPLDDAAPGAPSRAEQQLDEALSRLFAAILADRYVSPQIQILLSRLRPAVTGVARREPALLDSWHHPVWRFMDRIAFGAALHPADDDPLRQRMLNLVQGLVDNIVREPRQDAAAFAWGIDRLAAFEKHVYEQRRQAASPRIASLRALAQAEADSATAP